jgi:segregation and condensation protein A
LYRPGLITEDAAAMPLQEDYRVTLEGFEGPLDLLLYLIRRLEVDIHDIPIAKITDQYLAFLGQIDEVDVDLAGEFLVMAATLIELKSRTLMPPEEAERAAAADDTDRPAREIDAIDPRSELIQQLLAYQRYRIASEELDHRRIEFGERFPLRPGRPDLGEDDEAPIELELEDAHVMDLTEVYTRIMGSIDFGRLGDHIVELDDTPIALHQEDLLDRLGRTPERRMTLQQAFEGRGRAQRIGLFLATLELVRLRRVTVVQEAIDGEIELVLNEDPGEGEGEQTESRRDEETE